MAGHGPRPPGALVLSLDFELAWGVRHWATEEYLLNLEGARTAIPRMLQVFQEYGVAATWATVGFLFARSRDEVERYSPPESLRPAYEDSRLDPYAETFGADEREDPLHYAPSLIERIRATPRQEVATHTFSHFYCSAPGQTAEAFRADIAAAQAIAGRDGIELVSIVFPRNQHEPAYDAVLVEQGIRAYRGTPRAWMWRLAAVAPVRRAVRFVNSYANVSGHGTYPWSEVLQPNGLSNVRASGFLRPTSPHTRGQARLLLKRVARSMRYAARRREIFHLWWHPHNFGRHVEENLALLRAVLEEYARLRDEAGMVSVSMEEVDQAVRRVEPLPRVLGPARRPIL